MVFDPTDTAPYVRDVHDDAGPGGGGLSAGHEKAVAEGGASARTPAFESRTRLRAKGEHARHARKARVVITVRDRVAACPRIVEKAVVEGR
jgi:hypothetical protein